MAEGSKDIDKQTYGKGFLVQRSDMDEIQLNVVGAVHRIQRELIGSGVTADPPEIVLEDPLTLNVKIGPSMWIDANGKAFGWDSVQTVSCSAATHGGLVGSTAPNAVSSLRYIVVAGMHKYEDQQAKIDTEGNPYYWKQVSAADIRVYQTNDIASPDDALASTTLKTLLSAIETDGALPLVVVRRQKGLNTLDDWMWQLTRRTFMEGHPCDTRDMNRRIASFSQLPVIANSSGSIVVSGQSVPGNGGEIVITGGESVQIGWLDRSRPEYPTGYPLRIEVTVPGRTIPVVDLNSTYMLRMYVDERTREPILYTSSDTNGYLADTDYDLLSHGSQDGSNAGSRPTLLDIPLAEIKTGNAGAIPTVTALNNSVRTTLGMFIPWNYSLLWKNSDPLGQSESPPPSSQGEAIRLLIEDLKQHESGGGTNHEMTYESATGRIGGSVMTAGFEHRKIQPQDGTTWTLQAILSSLYQSTTWGERGPFFYPFAASTNGTDAFYNGEMYQWQETWMGGPDYCDASAIAQSVQMGELGWWLYTDNVSNNGGVYKKGTSANVGSPAAGKYGGIVIKADGGYATNLFLGQHGQKSANNRNLITLADTDRFIFNVRDFQLITSDGTNTTGRMLAGLVTSNLTDALNYIPTTIGNSDYVEGIYFTTRPDLGGNFYAVVKSAGTTNAVDTGISAYGPGVKALSFACREANKILFMVNRIVRANITIPNDFFTSRSYGPSLQVRERGAGGIVGLYAGPVTFTLVE